MSRIGTTFRLFTTLRPSSRAWTSPARRRTARCFMTPKRERSRKCSATSLVVRGLRRRRSRIARRVGSASALQTSSRSSFIGRIPRRHRRPARCLALFSALHVALYCFQHLFPGLSHAVLHFVLVLLRERAKHLVLEDELCPGGRRG